MQYSSLLPSDIVLDKDSLWLRDYSNYMVHPYRDCKG